MKKALTSTFWTLLKLLIVIWQQDCSAYFFPAVKNIKFKFKWHFWKKILSTPTLWPSTSELVPQGKCPAYSKYDKAPHDDINFVCHLLGTVSHLDSSNQERSPASKFSIHAMTQMIRRLALPFSFQTRENFWLSELMLYSGMRRCSMMTKQRCFSRPISCIYFTWIRTRLRWMGGNSLSWKS